MLSTICRVLLGVVPVCKLEKSLFQIKSFEMAACCSDTTADVEGEEGVTMVDVLHDEQALEADANAVLGDVSDTACTYPLGYLPRQPVYACNTCSEPEGGGKPAGVCLACSYHCHEVGMAQA